MRLSALVIFGSCLWTVQASGGEAQPGSLPEIVKRLKAEAKKPAQELIKAGLKLVREGGTTRLSDDLAFLTAVADRDPPAQRRKNLKDAVKVLELKYKDESDSLLRVLLREADVYRDGLGDRPKEREVFEKAEKLQKSLLIQQSLSQLAVFNKLGESYLGVLDATTKTQKKSREYFTKVIDFEFPGRPSQSTSYGAYQSLYIKAACRLVEMANDKEMKTLRFHPFAFESLQERFPKKSKYLSQENPWVAAFNARVERWLESTAKDLPKGSPLRPHFEGVLQYVRKDKPD